MAVASLPHSVFDKLALRGITCSKAFLVAFTASIVADACELLFADRLLPPEHSTEKLLTHWVANTCLFFLILYSMKRVRAEWKMAAERVSR